MSHTPGPWRACNKGKCSCKQVWCDDHPVAEVIVGKWGDKYTALRIIGGALEQKAEPYIDMVEYGEVDEVTATANARLVSAAPQLLEALEEIAEITQRKQLPITNQINEIAVSAIRAAKEGEGL